MEKEIIVYVGQVESSHILIGKRGKLCVGYAQGQPNKIM